MNKKKAWFFNKIGVQNTIIGGVGSTINTEALLADRFYVSGSDTIKISASDIENLEIIGNDVHFNIAIDYWIALGAFALNTDITFYDDKDGYVNRISHTGGGSNITSAFGNATNLQWINFPGCINIGQNSFHTCTSLLYAIFPSCINTAINLEEAGGSFRDCISLKYVDFPILGSLGIATIGGSMFLNCNPLQNINIPNITYVKSGGLSGCDFLYYGSDTVTEIGTGAFNSLDIGDNVVELPNCTQVIGGGLVFYRGEQKNIRLPKMIRGEVRSYANVSSPASKAKRYNFASMVDFNGDNTVWQQTFQGIATDCVFYTSPLNLTNGASGGTAADIQYIIDRGCTMVYVTNFDAPNPVTDLTITNITVNTFDVNFTAPAINTNANDYYDVFVINNDYEYPFWFLHSEVLATGDTVDLSAFQARFPGTNFDVKIRTSDIFNNVSTFSNIININTL